MTDLSKCQNCGGPADNGHDRCYPPSPYLCTKCIEAKPVGLTDELRIIASAMLANRNAEAVMLAADEIEKLRAELAAIKDVGMEPACFVSAELPNGDCFGAMAYQNKCGEDHVPLYTAAQLAKLKAERDDALAKLSVAREALLSCTIESNGWGHPVTMRFDECKVIAALSQLDSPNIVQQIEARAYRNAERLAYNWCLVPPDGGNPTDEERHLCDTLSEEFRKLAEQKEQ